MSLFQSQYALIEEVWKDTSQHTTRHPIHHDVTKALATTESSDAITRRTLNTTYQEQGIAGVKQYLDPSIVRDIQAEALARHFATKHTSFNLELSKDDWVYVLLGLFAILFAVDSKSS